MRRNANSAEGYSGYMELRNAIIIQAVKDYKRADSYAKRSIEKFFRSQWFGVLTNADPEKILE